MTKKFIALTFFGITLICTTKLSSMRRASSYRNQPAYREQAVQVDFSRLFHSALIQLDDFLKSQDISTLVAGGAADRYLVERLRTFMITMKQASGKTQPASLEEGPQENRELMYILYLEFLISSAALKYQRQIHRSLEYTSRSFLPEGDDVCTNPLSQYLGSKRFVRILARSIDPIVESKVGYFFIAKGVPRTDLAIFNRLGKGVIDIIRSPEFMRDKLLIDSGE